MSLSQKEEFIQVLRSWRGTPWRHQGRLPGPGGGLDCVGAPVMAAIEAGCTLKDYTDYSVTPNPRNFIAAISSQMAKIDVNAREAPFGSILAICIKDRIGPQHLMVRTDKGAIHSDQKSGKLEEVTYGPLVYERVHSVWEMPWEA